MEEFNVDEPTEILRPSHQILQRLVALWDEMGLDKHQRENRFKRAQEMVASFFQDLVCEEEHTKKMVQKRIEDLKNLIQQMANELGIPMDSSIETVPSMVQQEKSLHLRMTQLREMKEKRKSRFESLRLQEVTWSERLGQKSTAAMMPTDRLPTESEIDQFSDRVSSLNIEMDYRLSQAKSLAERLHGYIIELDMKEPVELNDWPKHDDVTEFEMNCPLTLPALARLREVTEHYQNRRDTAETRCDELLGEIEQLWSRLGTSEADKTIFLKQLPISKPASLRQLEDEVKRLHAIKRANMERFVEECRCELRQWWERCFVSVEEQQSWREVTEDEDITTVLEELEKEIARLKKYYEDNESGFHKVSEWNAAFEKLKITERKLKDPSVLSNRGGVLLKYEKSKRATQRQMQAQEASLGTFISLRVEGQPILAYIESRREAYEEEKENEKRERQEKHSTLLHKEMRYGSKPVVTPGKKRVLSSTLRQVNTTCTTLNASQHSKLRKMETSSSLFRKKLNACDSPITRYPLTPQSCTTQSPFRTPGTIPRSKKDEQRVSLARRRSRAAGAAPPTRQVAMLRTPTRSNPANSSRSTTYSEFVQDVHSRAARSSRGESSCKSSQCSSTRMTRL